MSERSEVGSPVFSCVVDSAPGMAYSAWVWAITLTGLGGQRPASLAVHFVEGCAPDLRRALDALGASTAAIDRFDPRHPPSNKLSQLSSPLLASAGHLVLCDCDIAFCGDVSSVVTGHEIRARTVDVAGVELGRWDRILEAAGLQGLSRMKGSGASTVRTLDGDPTLRAYCNGGFLVVPRDPFEILVDAWPRWNRWVLEHPELLGGPNYHADQVSFALACIDAGLEIELLPREVNMPTHIPRQVRALKGIDPLALHFHREIDPAGMLKPTGVSSVDRRIAAVNQLIAAQQGSDFDRSLLTGLGRPRMAARAKLRLLSGARRVRAAVVE
jgi:hypothetical protein